MFNRSCFFFLCLLFFFVWLEMQQQDRHVSTRGETELRNALCDSCRNRFEMLRSLCCLAGEALSGCSLTCVLLVLSQRRVCHQGGSMNNSCSFHETQPCIDPILPGLTFIAEKCLNTEYLLKNLLHNILMPGWNVPVCSDKLNFTFK